MPTPELNKALAAFQAKLPPIAKRETGKVEGVTKQGKPFSYEYSYADLADVSDAVLPLLGGHGLAYTAEPGTDDDGRLVLDYALLHVSGEERAKRFPLWLFVPDRATAQTIGGLLTYFRRYCLCAVTGVAPKGEDDDAAAASQAKPASQRSRSQRPPARPAATPGRSATTGAEHERLRHGTVEATPDDHPAQRTKGPIPDEENMWQEPPAANGTTGRVGMIVQHFKRLGVEDRGVRLGYTADLTGHAVTSTADLTGDEQKDLLKKLSSCKNHAALDSLSKQEAST
jgi:hypothetical protein